MKPRTFQAIVTKYLPCTNTRPGRIKATGAAGSVTIPEYSEDGGPHGIEDRHHAAAKALADKFGWRGHWFVGGMPNGCGNVYVCADMIDGAPAPAFVTTGKQ